MPKSNWLPQPLVLCFMGSNTLFNRPWNTIRLVPCRTSRRFFTPFEFLWSLGSSRYSVKWTQTFTGFSTNHHNLYIIGQGVSSFNVKWPWVSNVPTYIWRPEGSRRQCSRLKPSYEFYFEGLSNFRPLI
jgi:hypothetical protein